MHYEEATDRDKMMLITSGAKVLKLQENIVPSYIRKSSIATAFYKNKRRESRILIFDVDALEGETLTLTAILNLMILEDQNTNMIGKLKHINI